MHELLLFGQVPPSRHDQVLKVLAGISAMQPQPIIERHLVFKPTRPPGTRTNQTSPSIGIQGSQAQVLQAQMQGDLFYMQLVGDVKETSGDTLPASGITARTEDTVMGELVEEAKPDQGSTSNGLPKHDATLDDLDLSQQKWSLEFRDLPEVPGRRPVTSRLMASVQITNGDPVRFMDALGYKFVSEHVVQGHQLIHNNIILLLQRPLLVPLTRDGPQSMPSKHLPSVEKLQPLDPSNTSILQASIRVQDGSKPETVVIGTNELKAFKETIKGVVEMDIGDRLALDTRAR